MSWQFDILDDERNAEEIEIIQGTGFSSGQTEKYANFVPPDDLKSPPGNYFQTKRITKGELLWAFCDTYESTHEGDRAKWTSGWISLISLKNPNGGCRTRDNVDKVYGLVLDLDGLRSEAHRQEKIQILEQIGYRVPIIHSYSDGLPGKNGKVKVRSKALLIYPEGIDLETHWRVAASLDHHVLEGFYRGPGKGNSGGVADPACFKPEQPCYLIPRSAKERLGEPQILNSDQPWFNPHMWLHEYEPPLRKKWRMGRKDEKTRAAQRGEVHRMTDEERAALAALPLSADECEATFERFLRRKKQADLPDEGGQGRHGLGYILYCEAWKCGMFPAQASDYLVNRSAWNAAQQFPMTAEYAEAHGFHRIDQYVSKDDFGTSLPVKREKRAVKRSLRELMSESRLPPSDADADADPVPFGVATERAPEIATAVAAQIAVARADRIGSTSYARLARIAVARRDRIGSTSEPQRKLPEAFTRIIEARTASKRVGSDGFDAIAANAQTAVARADRIGSTSDVAPVDAAPEKVNFDRCNAATKRLAKLVKAIKAAKTNQVPLTYGPDATPVERAAEWSKSFDTTQSGMVVAPMGAGKTLLLRHLQGCAAARGINFTVVCPSIALTHQAANSLGLHHYADDPAKPGATSVMSVCKVKQAGYIAVDEFREALSQIYGLGKKNGKALQILERFARAWNAGRLLCLGADINDPICKAFISFAESYAKDPNKSYLILHDTMPVLHKQGARFSVQEGRHMLLRSVGKGGKHFVPCTSQGEAATYTEMLREAGARVALFDRLADRSEAIDTLFEDHDYVVATSACASGMNIRTLDVVTWLFDTYHEVDARMIVQMLGRVRNGTEVYFFCNNWERRRDLLTDVDRVRTSLMLEAKRNSELGRFVYVDDDADVDEDKDEDAYKEALRTEFYEFFDLYAELEVEDNVDAADRLAALERLFLENGWNIDMTDPVDDEKNPEEYKAAKAAAKDRQIEEIINADLSEATDAKNIGGRVPRSAQVANIKRQIMYTHALGDLSVDSLVHREIVWQDRDGQLTSKAERATLARMTEQTPNLNIYDQPVRKGANDTKKLNLSGSKVRQAQFVAGAWRAITGEAPGTTATLPDDYGDAALAWLGSSEYLTLFPTRKQPRTKTAASRAFLMLLKRYGSMSQKKVREGDDVFCRYTFTWQESLPRMNEDTILDIIDSKEARLYGRPRTRKKRLRELMGGVMVCQPKNEQTPSASQN